MDPAQRFRSLAKAFTYGLLGFCAFLAVPAPVLAHPNPFSYLDLRLEPGPRPAIDGSLVVHIFDVAHDLEIGTVEALLDAGYVERRAGPIMDMLTPRLVLTVDGTPVRGEWSQVETLPERQSIRVHVHYALDREPGVIAITATMFLYDPIHQTFVNVYDGDALTQKILNGEQRQFEYFARTVRGTFAAMRRFALAGLRRIVAAPDHVLFLAGLLLLGGSRRQLVMVVAAFTAAHGITLSLAALGLVTSPERIIEPAIALSIVYVGADNLLVSQGRDMRAWIALAFGVIHGFGTAGVFREMDAPSSVLRWSLAAFNAGAAAGQLLVFGLVASVLAALRSRGESTERQFAFAGSIAVILAGTFWFIQRVFFPGGMS